MLRYFTLVLAAVALTACTNPNDLDEKPVYLGGFHLGHNVVVAPNLTKGPASREASKEEWIEAMQLAIEDRFGRYDGERLYHLGISVEGYVLAIPGVPIVASPKSALILNVTAWDDAAGKKLNEKPHQVTVLESFSGTTFLGSGLTQTKEKQMQNLSRNAAKLIQNWLEQENNQNGWFEADGQPASSKQTTETLAGEGKDEVAVVEAEAQSDAPETATDDILLDDPEVVPPTGDDG